MRAIDDLSIRSRIEAPYSMKGPALSNVDLGTKQEEGAGVVAIVNDAIAASKVKNDWIKCTQARSNVHENIPGCVARSGKMVLVSSQKRGRMSWSSG